MANKELTDGQARQPDVYHDPTEAVWKGIALGGYGEITGQLAEVDVLCDPEIRRLRTRAIDAFNSNHSQDVFCGRVNVILQKLNQRLEALGRPDVYASIMQTVQDSRGQISETLGILDQARIAYPHREQTHIQDGSIEIAGMPIEEFSNQPDYFSATLRLFSEPDDRFRLHAEASFMQGFTLSDSEAQLIEQAKDQQWPVEDLITQQLLHQQLANRHDSIQKYEHKPNADEEINHQRKEGALGEAYYLMGKIISTIAAFTDESTGRETSVPESLSDPVALFLHAAGKDLNPEQLAAVRKVALAHSSHGLNSGELTAQLAGSVRTSFPRALIASFNIRSGILHAGAVGECMRQTKEFLDSDTDPETYINGILARNEKLYGFGHRIHKINPTDPAEVLGKDPRVALYIAACREGFPEKAGEIDRLVSYAEAIRKLHPSLGANTDFGASVLFHALELPANAASGFFLAFRTPGVCAQVVNELAVKGNSRRPPFPPVLSY